MSLRLDKVGVGPADRRGAVVFNDTSGDSLHLTGPVIATLFHTGACTSPNTMLGVRLEPGAFHVSCPACCADARFPRVHLVQAIEWVKEPIQGRSAQIESRDQRVVFTRFETSN